MLHNSLYNALSTVQEAANYWVEYLEENDREDEIEPIDKANELIDELKKLI